MNGVLYFETKLCSVAGLSRCFLAVFQWCQGFCCAHDGIPLQDGCACQWVSQVTTQQLWLCRRLKKCRFFVVFFLPDFCLHIQSYHDHLGYSPIKMDLVQICSALGFPVNPPRPIFGLAGTLDWQCRDLWRFPTMGFSGSKNVELSERD